MLIGQLSFELEILFLAIGIIVVALLAQRAFLRPRKNNGGVLAKKLAETEQRLETLIEASNDWLWQVDKDLVCTYSSPQVVTVLGYSPQEIVGKRPTDFMPPDQAEQCRRLISQSIDTKTAFRNFQSRNLAKDGRIVYLESTGIPLLDRRGNVKGFRGINRDITDRRLAEQASEEYRRRMESLIGNLFGMAYRCKNTPDWPMEFISPGCREITGYSPADFIDGKITLNRIIHPEDRQAVWQRVQDALAQKRPFNLEYRLYDKNGCLRWVVERGGGIWENGQLQSLEGLVVDISDTKAVQQELRQSREYLESVFRSLPIGLAVTSNRMLLNVNQQLCEMFGYGREELIGKSSRILYPSAEAYDQVGHRVFDQIRYTGRVNMETVLIHKNGRPIEMLISGAAVDAKNPDKGCTFSFMDVTERNRVNRQLAMRLKLEKLIADISGGFVNVPVEGIDDKIMQSLQMLVEGLGFERVRLMQINPDSGKIFASGYHAAAAGKRLLIHSDDLDRDMPEYAGLIRQKRTLCWSQNAESISDRLPELRKFCRDNNICAHLCIPMTIGQEHIGALTVTHMQEPPVVDEDLLGYLRVVADTLANTIVRKNALEALACSESRFRSIFECSPMGIHTYKLLADNTLKLTGSNPAASRILQFDMQPFTGRPIEEAFPGLEEAGICEIYRRLCRQGGTYHGENFTYKDEHVHGVYEFEAFRIIPDNLAVMFTDITDRRLAEQARERLMRQLRIKNDELESLVYIASHDLKSPLVNIRGFSGELQKSLDALRRRLDSEPLSDAARELVAGLFENDFPESMNFINSGTAKMESMLNGLLQFSRIDTAQSKPECLEITPLLEQVLRHFRYQLKEDDIQIEIADNLPRCMGDSLLISQLFSNLIDNAIKYRSPKRPLVIRVEGEIDGDEVQYSVSDNGIGIAPEHIGKVFEIFHQLNPDKSKNGQGLGLTIVRKIAEIQEGRVWIESVPDQGTTVFVRLTRV